MAVHKKIVIPQSRFGPNIFADYYHYGEKEGPEVPLMAYLGGALSRKEYEQRLNSQPEPVVKELEKAMGEKQAGFSLDLLVIPCPVFNPEPSENLRKEILQFFVFDLLPQTSNPRPHALGYVGFSFGAYLGACLAFDLPRSKALATLGGTGMATAAWDARDTAFEGKKFMSFGNADDPLAMENYKFLHALVARGLDMEVELGVGGHEFQDYVKNGFVKRAFAFVLEALLSPSA